VLGVLLLGGLALQLARPQIMRLFVDTALARGVKLSGGQRQRAAAARMLVRDAELLVFDDLSASSRPAPRRAPSGPRTVKHLGPHALPYGSAPIRHS
jgi:hypothetical protein